MTLRVAVVIPWFGRELLGGAEQQAWQVATRLAHKGVQVTALTTCSKAFASDWSSNHFAPGVYADAGVSIRRFPVREQDRPAFEEAVRKLHLLRKDQLRAGLCPVTEVDELVYLEENINSPALIDYVRAEKNSYDVFFCLPYLFPTIIDVTRHAAEKTILQPCLHDESYAYLESVGRMFARVRQIIFLSQGERELAERLFGTSIRDKSYVGGAGIEIDARILSESPDPASIKGEYLLYLGRRDSGKNVDFLINAFEAYVRASGSRLRLAIAGIGPLPAKPTTPNVVDCGVVTEDEKIALLKNCVALINLSKNESFSRVMYEAWAAKKPVIVNSQCQATSQALRDSGGAGWHCDSAETLAKVLADLENISPARRLDVGARGHRFTRESTDWDKIIESYVGVFENIAASNRGPKIVRRLNPAKCGSSARVVIAYESILDVDAIGIDVLQQFRSLQRNGYEPYLYGVNFRVDLQRNGLSRDHILSESKFCELLRKPETTLIYHHGNYWAKGLDYLNAAVGPTLIKYHNVTPPLYFLDFDPATCEWTLHGRQQTRLIVQSAKPHRYLADSAYNAQELVELGAPPADVLVLPPFHKIADFDKHEINHELMARIRNGKINLLHVGRHAPNKRIDAMIHVVRQYVATYDRNICLHVVGSVHSRQYSDHLRHMVQYLGLEDCVQFHSEIPFRDLKTFYQAADFYLVMSDHEGFCVPILEAQYHRIPILALDRAAVKYTLGRNQILFREADFLGLSAAIRVVHNEPLYRSRLTAFGHENYERYDFERLSQRFIDIMAGRPDVERDFS